MGHAKHRKKGVVPKSPKMRMQLQLDAQRADSIKPKSYDMKSSMKELFDDV